LGVLQGVLEWLPISSKGNLVLLMLYFLGIDAATALELSIFLHTGTLLSAALYFRKELIGILSSLGGGAAHNDSRRLLVFLFIATILTGITGFPLFLLAKATATIEEGFIALTGIALILTGLLEKVGGRIRGLRTTSNLGTEDAAVVGLAQGFSALPGVSRSGITTTVLLIRGFKGDEALRLSFLLSIPAVLSAEIGTTALYGLPHFSWDMLLFAVVAAFSSSLISIHVLMRLAKKTKLWLLCLVLGTLSLIPLLGYI